MLFWYSFVAFLHADRPGLAAKTAHTLTSLSISSPALAALRRDGYRKTVPWVDSSLFFSVVCVSAHLGEIGIKEGRH